MVDGPPVAARHRRPELAAVLEAVLYASAEPLSLARLAAATDRSPGEVERALDELVRDYDAVGSGLQLRYAGGGYQMATRGEHAAAVGRAVGRLRTGLSPAALETLALIALSQPITAPEIETVRHAQSDGVLATLLAKKLIAKAGRRPTPGRPLQYRTTRHFQTLFGLRDLADLKEKLGEFLPAKSRP